MTGSSDRLRRPRPERQADAGRAAARSAEGRGPQGAAGLVSRLRHVDRRRDRARAAGRARVRPGRDAAPLHRQPVRAEARSAAVARRRPDPRLRSLHGVEHRLRRSAGARSRVAHRHAEVPARGRRSRSCSTSRPETAVQRKAVEPRSLRARPGAAGARARELPAPGGRPGWVRLDGERPKDVDRRRTSSAPSRHDSRRRKRAHLAHAALPSSARAHASSVAPVVLTSSTSTTIRSVRATPAARVAANAPRTLRWRCAAGSRPAWRSPARARAPRDTADPRCAPDRPPG